MPSQIHGQTGGWTEGWSCINHISIDQAKTYGTVGTASRGEEKKKENRKKERK